MSGPAYTQSLTVHFDDDGFDLVSRTPGPAGSVELNLVSDVSIAVDFADPSSLTAIRVNGDEVPDVLADLIGQERTERLGNLERNSLGKAARLSPVDSESEFPTFRRGMGSQPTRRGPVGRELGALSRLRSIGEDEDVAELVRATAVLEFVTRAAEYDYEVAELVQTSIEDVGLAAHLLEGLDDDFRTLSTRDPKTAIQLAGLCARFESEFDSLRQARDVLMNPIPQYDERLGDHAELASAGYLYAPPDFDYEARIRLSAVTLRDGGRLSARVTEFEEDWWLRVALEGTQVLLALVPLLERGDRASVEALLPTDVALNEIDLTLTNSPLTTVTSSIDAVMKAVNLGRAAVRASLIRRHWEQDERWRKCAEAWEAAGDLQRANRARMYAEKGLTRVGPRLITREVMAVFEPED